MTINNKFLDFIQDEVKQSLEKDKFLKSFFPKVPFQYHSFVNGRIEKLHNGNFEEYLKSI